MNDPRWEQDVRELHCSFCGAVQWFSALQMKMIRIVPPCPRCRETTWLHVDEQAARWPSAVI